MKTNLFTLTGSMLLLGVLLAIANSALANAPHDAGWKARGMHDSTSSRTQRYYSAPATPAPAGRQAFSYEPSSAPAPAVAAPAPRAAAGYRAYTYQPQPTRVYSSAPRRGYNHNTDHLGGNYASKATLYNH